MDNPWLRSQDHHTGVVGSGDPQMASTVDNPRGRQRQGRWGSCHVEDVVGREFKVIRVFNLIGVHQWRTLKWRLVLRERHLLSRRRSSFVNSSTMHLMRWIRFDSKACLAGLHHNCSR